MTDPNNIQFTNSSNIVAASFDPETNKVSVDFKNGQRYTYANFTPELMTEWRSAKSPGGWFNSIVKSDPEKYPVIGEASRSPAIATAPLAADSTTEPTGEMPAVTASTGALDSAVSTTDPTPSQDAPKAGGSVMPAVNPNVAYTAPQPKPQAPAGVLPGGRHVSKRDVGPHGSRAAVQTGFETANATAGIAASTPDGKAAIADTQKAHDARRAARDWRNRPWKNGPNGTTTPAK